MKILCLSGGCGGGGGGGGGGCLPISQLSPERQILTDNTVKLGHSLDRRWGGWGGGGVEGTQSRKIRTEELILIVLIKSTIASTSQDYQINQST